MRSFAHRCRDTWLPPCCSSACQIPAGPPEEQVQRPGAIASSIVPADGMLRVHAGTDHTVIIRIDHTIIR